MQHHVSDGQLLFLMEMVSKLKPTSISPIGSRIASVHNGSSLFTGDAGGGESNIRRYIIENDLLNAIVQLPNNLFITQALPLIFGCCPITNLKTVRAKYS
jgi:type I restriction-modification system DNA methylase subunit